MIRAAIFLTALFWAGQTLAQTGPSRAEEAAYTGLHAAAANGDLPALRKLIAAKVAFNSRDGHGRTPLMVAAFKRNHAAARLLIEAGADLDLLENDRYDVLTISGGIDDPVMVKIAIAAGANTGLSTSRYDGTALIASAHLGHVEVVRALIKGKAPLDHVNNLGWTALIEAIVLGDGGANHQAIVRDLIKAGANLNLADSNGTRPLRLAQSRGYREMAKMLEAAGARP